MNKINIVCPINQLGYGLFSLNIVKELSKKLDVFLWCMGEPDCNNEDFTLINELRKKTTFYDCNAPSLKIWHQNDLSMHPSRNNRSALTIFELEPLTKEEVHQMNSMDKIFLPTDWAVDVAISSGVKKEKIYKTPFGVDNKIFYEKNKIKENDKITFINIGKWEIRKGHDILIKAFKKAFPKDPNVELIMHCDNPFLSEKERNEWESYYSFDNRIKISHRFKTQQELAELIKRCDCGIFPARAEGWNMELAEMLAMGKHCIATNATAHKEFVNKDVCELVEVDKLVRAYDNKWFYGQGYWPNLNDKTIFQLSEKMILVKNKIQSGILNNDNAYEHMKKYTWEKTAEKITESINEH